MGNNWTRGKRPWLECDPANWVDVVSRPGIAVSGKAGAGKGALADLLIDGMYPSHAGVRFGFADAIKRDVLAEHGLRKGDPGGRDKLIEVGEARRREDAHHWIKVLEPQLRSAWSRGQVIVVDDLRFPEELEFLHGHGFFTVKVWAESDVRERRLVADGHDPLIVRSMDVTECALDGAVGFDEVVWNGGDRTNLELEAQRVLVKAGRWPTL